MNLLNIQVKLPVNNLGIAQDFYVTHFGFVVKQTNAQFVEFDNNILLTLRDASDRENKQEDFIARKSPRLIFYVSSAALAYKELVDSNVFIEEPPISQNGQKSFVFSDGQGNRCEVIEILENR